MLGKSFIIGVVFAGLSAGVVYFGVGESLETANVPKSLIESLSEKINTNEDTEAEVKTEASMSEPAPAITETPQVTITAEPDAGESTVPKQTDSVQKTVNPASVKSDRTILLEAKAAANAGLYLDSADLIADIKSPLMRDTARSNLALALARDGEKDFAMAVVEDVETDALAEIMLAQINQALSQ